MPTKTIEADYLVIGAGAMGMAFVDTVIAESQATVVLVDRHDQPGGHWLSAYPFVRLHQPSAFYGVNSRPLGNDTIDAGGWNEGFYELATGSEIRAYYDAVMRQQLLPTGRVSYFPMSEYLGDDRFRTLGGEDYRVKVGRRIVDATYLGVVVPSMRPPQYDVAPGVDCIPPNELPKRAAHEQYVIVGAGKTAFDSSLWLLRHGIAPDRLTWVRPRESWLLDRAAIQPGPAFAPQVIADFIAQMKASVKAETVADLFARLAAAGCLLRIDDDAEPTMYRCAIVSKPELAQLKRIDDVIRLGHVTALEPGRISLDGGTVDTDPNALYVDCTGDGLGKRPAVDVFAADRITLQPVRSCQPTFSAAAIGHVEVTKSEAAKNAYCRPVPHPTEPLDWLRMTVAFNDNQLRWFDDAEMLAWLDGARLNVVSHMSTGTTPTPPDMVPLGEQLRYVNERLVALLARA